jgi:hypothetical protein
MCWVTTGLSVGTLEHEAYAQTIAGYWVDNYGGTNNLLNSQANTQNFENSMTEGNDPWSLYFDKGDGRVNDNNFYDPDVTGNPYDNDTTQMDSDAAFIEVLYYTGHGAGPPGSPSTAGCNHNDDCTSPPSGFSLPAYCVSYPNVQKYTGSSDPGVCRYLWTQAAFLNGNAPHHKQVVSFGPGAGVALGETYFSGDWAGAAENGGTKMAIFDQSFGTQPEQWTINMYGMFAGIHLIATMLPVAGDTGNVPDRGAAFAAAYHVEPNASIAGAWTNALNLVSASEGYPCTAQNGTQYEGYHGLDGCGCNWVMSVDASSSLVNYHISAETWNTLYDGNYDATGNDWYAWSDVCNYPVDDYPFSQ